MSKKDDEKWPEIPPGYLISQLNKRVRAHESMVQSGLLHSPLSNNPVEVRVLILRVIFI